MNLEMNQSRQEKQFKDTVTAISDATQQEFDKMQKTIDDIARVIENQKTSQILERETMLHQVTQNIMSNMLPEVDSRVKRELDTERLKIRNDVDRVS